MTVDEPCSVPEEVNRYTVVKQLVVDSAQVLVVGVFEDALGSDGALNHFTEFDGTRVGKSDVRNVEGQKIASESLWGRGLSKALRSIEVGEVGEDDG